MMNKALPPPEAGGEALQWLDNEGMPDTFSVLRSP
jgi:hypothetical protein